MRRENGHAKWRAAEGQKETILSLRPPRGPGLLVAFACTLTIIGIAHVHTVGYLGDRLTLTAVICLAFLGGLAASNVLHPVLEARLERDALFVRDPWTARRYPWRNIPEPFYVLTGKFGAKVTFTWYCGPTVKRAFLPPDCLRISAESLAALLNDRREQASRLGTISAVGPTSDDTASDIVVENS